MRYGPKWDARFMAIACEVASWSKDPRKKVGAVFVSPDGLQVSWGYNGLPRGVDDDKQLEPEERRQLTTHAERNARDNCRTRPSGWHIFVTEFPCAQCATTIIRSGIARLVAPPICDGSSWAESQRLAKATLIKAGITVKEYIP